MKKFISRIRLILRVITGIVVIIDLTMIVVGVLMLLGLMIFELFNFQ